MSISRNKHQPKLSAWTLGVVLVLLLAQVQGLVPLLLAALARADGEHRVLLGAQGEAFQIVLRHEANNRSHGEGLSAHRHQLMGRMLVALAQPVTGPAQDHVLSLRCAGSQEPLLAPRLDGQTGEVLVTPPAGLLGGPLLAVRPPICLTPVGTARTRPPPPSASTAFVRQSVLLI